jgi:RNA polymerase sigma factor (sigma-70 family)
MGKPDETEDDLVLEFIESVDDSARDATFAKILNRFGKDIGHWIHRQFEGSPSWDILEDVLQETLMAAWKSRNDFDDRKGTFRSWLRKIALNQVRERIRHDSAIKRGGQVRTVSLTPGESGVGPPEPSVPDSVSESVENREVLERFLKAVEQLPLLQRDIVGNLMRSSEPDWQVPREVDEALARRHNTTVGTIRVERSKALSHLRHIIIEGG